MILELIATPVTDASVVTDIQNAWTYETSADGANWTKNHASYGQCAVTSLLVQRIAGGFIQRSDAILPSGEALSHWYNVVDGRKLDLTAAQFPDGTTFRAKGDLMSEPDAVAYAFKNESTESRFHILLENFLKERGKSLGYLKSGKLAA
jgi:hypothetical protein